MLFPISQFIPLFIVLSAFPKKLLNSSWYIYQLPREIFVEIFDPLFNCSFIILSFTDSLYILDSNLLSNVWFFQYFPPVCGLSSDPLISVYQGAHIFKLKSKLSTFFHALSFCR